MAEAIVDRAEIAAGLRRLGVRNGGVLMVHSSITSLGQVAGGPDAVIDALLDAIGPQGTLMMSTNPAYDENLFDVGTTPSAMGVISETFRKRPGVLRSRNPFHPVAATGPLAAAMLDGHEHSAVPDGPEGPYGRHLARDGQVLLLGCDVDTLTLLHTVEAELDLPYLRRLDMAYRAEDGSVQTAHLERCPGGHRGGVLKLDRLFRNEGAIRVGRIGSAVCRLLTAQSAADIMRRELRQDPFFVLDDNPACHDCGVFRGKIKAARLDQEDFQLSAPLWAVDPDASRAARVLQSEGIGAAELRLSEGQAPSGVQSHCDLLRDMGITAVALRVDGGDLALLRQGYDLALTAGIPAVHVSPPTGDGAGLFAWREEMERLAKRGEADGTTILLVNRVGSEVGTGERLTRFIRDFESPAVRASFDPAASALMGEEPFEGAVSGKQLRRLIAHVELHDARMQDGASVPLGQGNGQVRELVSNLRCRSYDGILCLWPEPGRHEGGFRAAARWFWQMLAEI